MTRAMNPVRIGAATAIAFAKAGANAVLVAHDVAAADVRVADADAGEIRERLLDASVELGLLRLLVHLVRFRDQGLTGWEASAPLATSAWTASAVPPDCSMELTASSAGPWPVA